MRFVVTAGYDRALHAVAIVDGLARAGHDIAAVLVVSTLDLTRARAFIRQRGLGALGGAVRRALGSRPGGPDDDEMAAWAAARALTDRSLSALCRRLGIPRVVVASLQGDEAIEAMRRAHPERVLYAGGGILRSRFLRHAGGPILNAHSGPLPEIRGMNACEWSILLGVRTAVTIHLIDEGIDTGTVLAEIPLPVRAGDTLARLRSRCAVLGVEGLLRAAAAPLLPPPAPVSPAYRQCYVMAPALRELVEQRLRSRE